MNVKQNELLAAVEAAEDATADLTHRLRQALSAADAVASIVLDDLFKRSQAMAREIASLEKAIVDRIKTP